MYRGLDIGTGKVTKKEMAGVPHHLLDVVSPRKQFTVDDFVRLGTKAYSNILQNVRIPIVVGGTGLYVDALLGCLSYPHVPPNPKLREQLERLSTEKLFAQLKKLDPRRAASIDKENPRRLIRAIEIAKAIGTIPSVDQVYRSVASIDVLWLGINPGQKKLQQNIHIRLFARIRAGMIGEAKRLHARGLSYKHMEALGLEYRYLARLLQNKISKKEFEEQLESAIRRYAKRQMRWFTRNKDIHWISSRMQTLPLAKEFLSGR